MNTIVFQKGKCLNCDTSISTGILCLKCTPPAPSKAALPREVTISEMKEGDVGFTEEYAVFEVDGKLFLLGTARISPESEGYKTMKIKVKHAFFEIDRQTIDTDDIYLGWPDMDDHPDCFQAKLV